MPTKTFGQLIVQLNIHHKVAQRLIQRPIQNPHFQTLQPAVPLFRTLWLPWTSPWTAALATVTPEVAAAMAGRELVGVFGVELFRPVRWTSQPMVTNHSQATLNPKQVNDW